MLCFLAGTIACALAEYTFTHNIVVIAVSSPLVGLVLIPYTRWISKRRVMGLLSERGGTLGKHDLRIGPEGVFDRTKSGEGLTRWDGVIEIVENHQYIFFFVDRFAAHIVPKRAMENTNDVKAFLSSATTYWKNAQR